MGEFHATLEAKREQQVDGERAVDVFRQREFAAHEARRDPQRESQRDWREEVGFERVDHGGNIGTTS